MTEQVNPTEAETIKDSKPLHETHSNKKVTSPLSRSPSRSPF